jgi:outer membrane receptor protein involved in Fe transport
VFIGNNESNIAQSFGVKRLEPEKSNSYNVGIEWKNKSKEHPLNIKADYSYIKLDNRIIISGFFDTTNVSFKNFLKSQEKYDVTSALFCINYLTTETHNVDVNASLESGVHHFLVGFNFNKTIIDEQASHDNLPTKLQAAESEFFNREEKSRYTEIIPAWKLFVMWNGQCSIKSNFLTWKLQATAFGNNTYRDPLNPMFDQVYENWKTPLIDMEVGYKIKGSVTIALGCNNLFNERSNKIKKPANLSAAQEKEWFNNISYYNLFQYSRRVQTFGVGGIFPYVKASYQFGK